MTWRNAYASMQLIAEVNARWPRRDRSSDGTIGDAAHAARTSDHNPWLQKGGQGVVRARDIDKDGIDAAWLCEHLRLLGAAGDPRLRPGGYLIFNRRITNPDFRSWRTYTGSNPHTGHVHVSFSTDPSARGFDSTAGWGITGAASTATADTQPATPVRKKVKPVIDREKLVKGPNYVRLPAMVGAASGLYGRAWVSVSAHGGASDATVLFQRDTDTDGAPAGTRDQWKPVLKNGSREWIEVPSGTEYLECWVNVRGDGGFVAVEFQPK